MSIVTFTWIFVGFFEALGRIDEFKMRVSLVLIFGGILTSVAAGYINSEWAVSSVVAWFKDAVVGAVFGEAVGEFVKAFMRKM